MLEMLALCIDQFLLDEDIDPDCMALTALEVNDQPNVIELARVQVTRCPIHAEKDVKLVYSAKLRTEDLKGKAYLEMLIFYPDGSKNFSRSLKSALSETSGWSDESVSFPLKKGQKPSAVKLNLVIDGTGTVWVDDVKLVKNSP